MKKTVIALLALFIIMSFTACSNPASTEQSTAEPSSQADLTGDADTGKRDQLRVGMECAYAPNNWQESKATDTNVPIENVPGAYAEGYDVQIARTIAEQLDMELVIVKMPWDGLIEALNQEQIDAIIAGMMESPERRESINFSEPYRITGYGLMVKQDSVYADAVSIQDFAGASILGQKNTRLDTFIDQIEGVNHLTPVNTVPDMISRLTQGTCDAIIVNVENRSAYLAANPDFKVISFADGKGFEVDTNAVRVGLRKSDTDLLSQINTVLETIDENTRTEMWETAISNQPQ